MSNGRILGVFNSTFLAMIPRKDILETFEDFKPISLCNDVYKIIANRISKGLKHVLSLTILGEKFGFLDGRRIHESIGTTQ
jgi:hypothetical protein